MFRNPGLSGSSVCGAPVEAVPDPAAVEDARVFMGAIARRFTDMAGGIITNADVHTPGVCGDPVLAGFTMGIGGKALAIEADAFRRTDRGAADNGAHVSIARFRFAERRALDAATRGIRDNRPRSCSLSAPALDGTATPRAPFTDRAIDGFNRGKPTAAVFADGGEADIVRCAGIPAIAAISDCSRKGIPTRQKDRSGARAYLLVDDWNVSVTGVVADADFGRFRAGVASANQCERPAEDPPAKTLYESPP